MNANKEKALEAALGQIERQFGKGTVMRMGEAGAGQLTKMVNQICIAGLVQGLSEGMNFAMAA